MSSVSETQHQMICDTNFKENSLFNKAIWTSKKIAGLSAVACVSGIVSTIFWKTYCSTLSSCEVTSPSSFLLFGAMISYNIFEERESVYKTYLTFGVRPDIRTLSTLIGLFQFGPNRLHRFFNCQCPDVSPDHSTPFP